MVLCSVVLGSVVLGSVVLSETVELVVGSEVVGADVVVSTRSSLRSQVTFWFATSGTHIALLVASQTVPVGQ